LNDIIISARIEVASAYIQAYYASLQSAWDEMYQLYLDDELKLAASLALAHPDHYKELPNSNQIRGQRSFSKDTAHDSINCSCKTIWGYKCSVNIALWGISADHLFPFSLGGPTIGSNKMYLCAMHNQLKGNDVHFYPWEQGEPIWLQDTLFKIHQLRRSSVSRLL